jgi:NAD(P)H-nitrite reductase large subunit
VKACSISQIVLESEEIVSAHIILLFAGVRPRTAIAQEAGLECNTFGVIADEHIKTSDPDIYAMGDMACTMKGVTSKQHSLALTGLANRQGQFVADHMFRR